MIELKLYWLVKNDVMRKGIQGLSYQLGVNRTILDRLLAFKSTQINLALLRKIDTEIESCRKLSVIIDASFLLPRDIDYGWRFASFDLIGEWRLHYTAYPPVLDSETRKWTPCYESTQEANSKVQPLVGFGRRIPVDADVFSEGNEALYQRCMETGLWYKAYAAPRVQLTVNQEHTTRTRQEYIEESKHRYIL